jgi:hypothetical protein
MQNGELFFKEPDRLLVGGILFLLMQEKTNPRLILALLYILL